MKWNVDKFLAASASMLERRIDEYFAICELEEWRPTLHGLARHLGILSYDLERVRDGAFDDDDLRRSRIIEGAIDRLVDIYQRKGSSFDNFLLKQKELGGFIDRPLAANKSSGREPLAIRVTFDGCTADEVDNFAG